MKCIICKSPDIKTKSVEEEFKAGNDIVLVSLDVLVCLNCGERYYDRKTMKKLEEMKLRAKEHSLKVEEVGKVLRAPAA